MNVIVTRIAESDTTHRVIAVSNRNNVEATINNHYNNVTDFAAWGEFTATIDGDATPVYFDVMTVDNL